MPRIRSVKPEFWTDPAMADLPRDARLLYVALWNHADEHGRLQGDPRLIKGQAFPYDDDLTAADVDRLLDALAERDRIVRYEVCGYRYLHLPYLAKHQRLDDRIPSRLPGPPCDTSITARVADVTPPQPDLFSDETAGQTANASATQVHTDLSAPLYVAGSRLQGAGDKHTPDADAPGRVLAVVPDPWPTFDDFWQAYPRKVGKRDAERAWGKALRKANPAVLVAAARRMAADPNLPEQQFVPHPTTWLNAERWTDPPYPPRRAGAGANSTGETVEQVFRRAVGQPPAPWTSPEVEQ